MLKNISFVFFGILLYDLSRAANVTNSSRAVHNHTQLKIKNHVTTEIPKPNDMYDNDNYVESLDVSESVSRAGKMGSKLDHRIGAFIESTRDLAKEAGRVYADEVNKTRYDNAATEFWVGFGVTLRRIIESFMNHMMPMLMDASSDMDISMDCLTTMFEAIDGLKEEKDWAMKLIDASGKPFTSGILGGSITDLGSFDQCINIDAHDKNGQLFVGQYCLLKYSLPLPPKPKHLTLQTKVFNFSGTPIEETFLEDFASMAHVFYERVGRIGICVPSTCSKDDISTIISKLMDKSHIKIAISNCQLKEPINFSSSQIVILSIFGVIIFLMIVSTSIDLIIVYTRQPETETQRTIRVKSKAKLFLATLLSFSVYTNGKFLFNTKSPSNFIDAINGIRVLSMVWIVWTHTYLIPIKETFVFARDFMYVVEELLFQLILNGWVLVDSFFLVGALLSTYAQLSYIKKSEGKLNFVKLIVNRFMRLSPEIWITIMLMIVIPIMASGPLWHEYWDVQVNKCHGYWWATILFFNNWFDESKMCLLHTWYLSADFQLFLIALLFLIPLYKKPKLGLALILALISASALAIGIRTYLLRQTPTITYNTPLESDVNKQASTIYIHTYIHIGPYFVGVIVGYLLYRKKEYYFNPYLRLIYWLLALSGCLSVMLLTHPLNSGKEWPLFTSALYAGLHRTVWAVSVGWIAFACATGHGGPINTFLSWKFFVPLGKLSYLIYLMHFLIIWFRYAVIRVQMPFNHYTMFCEFILSFVFSIFAAIVIYLAVEAPISRIYRILFYKAFDCATITINGSIKKNNNDTSNFTSRL